MMKKTLILASVLLVSTSVMTYAQEQSTLPKAPEITAGQRPDIKMPPKGPDFKKRQAEFENRLKLTDEQKQKAKEIREKGFEKMKPIMEKLKEKQKEIMALKKSENPDQTRLEQLKKEIGALKRESHELRMQNMKEFEGILTKKQLKELTKMKEEGRKKFEQEHKRHPNYEYKPLPQKK